MIIQYKPNGEIVRWSSSGIENTEGLQLLSLDIPPPSADLYVSGGEVLPRPTLDFPVSHQIIAGEDWNPVSVPANTEVFVDGFFQGITDETGLTLAFQMQGVWRVDLRPPFPWFPASCEVTVT